jgi:hypothetical protein
MKKIRNGTKQNLTNICVSCRSCVDLEAISAFMSATSEANINFNGRTICLMVMAYDQMLIGLNSLYLICFVKEHNV